MRPSTQRPRIHAATKTLLASALALGALLLACRSSGQGEEPSPPTVLDELIARARRDGDVRVVVEFLRETAPEADLDPAAVAVQQREIRSAQNYLRQELDGFFEEGGLVLFGPLPFLSLRLQEDGLRQLDSVSRTLEKLAEEEPTDPRARYRFRFSADVALKRHGSAAMSPPLAITRDMVGANALPAEVTGEGVSIAVIDDGVDFTLSVLGGSAPAGAFFTADELRNCGGVMQNWCRGTADLGMPLLATPAGDCPALSHGTEVAMAACSDQGLAPKAEVIPIRVEGSNGIINLTDVARAVVDLVDPWWSTHSIRVVCISLGTEATYATTSECSGGAGAPEIEAAALSALAGACASVRAAGISIVVSAGNDGARGTLPSPACLDTTIAVAGTIKLSNPTSYETTGKVGLHIASNWAEGVEVCAPAVSMSVDLGAPLLCGLGSGTSIAAPVVAGGLALLIQGVPGVSADLLVPALGASPYIVEDPLEWDSSGAATVWLRRPFLRLDAGLVLLAAPPVPVPVDPVDPPVDPVDPPVDPDPVDPDPEEEDPSGGAVRVEDPGR